MMVEDRGSYLEFYSMYRQFLSFERIEGNRDEAAGVSKERKARGEY